MPGALKRCSACGADKALDDFHVIQTGASAGYRMAACKPCRRARCAAQSRKHLPRQRRYSREYRAKNREKWRAVIRENGRKHRVALRLEVLSAYGGACACCGEAHTEFLAIDHINGGGSRHKKELRGHLYSWLKKRGFPKGFRVLCHNCNQSRGAYGFCPHEAAMHEVPYAVRMEA